MSIKKYNNFILESKLITLINEARIQYFDEFKKVLSRLKSPIAKDILEMSDKDIDTNINYIDTTNKDGYLSFLPKNAKVKYEIVDNGWTYETWEKLIRCVGEEGDRYPTLSNGTVGEIIKIVTKEDLPQLADGREIAYFVSDSDDVSFVDMKGLKMVNKGKNQEMKIGRLAIQLLQSIKKSYSDKEIEQFVNEFKSQLEIIRDKFNYFELVSGDLIRHFYSENQYDNRKSGPLHSSCMKGSKCQSFFGIYTDNPSVCQLLILKSDVDDAKIVGRALVWKLVDDTYFMDRIYYVNDSQVNLFKEYAMSKGWCYKTRQESSDSTPIEFSPDKRYYEDLTVKLEKSEFRKYPYMDTLKYLDEGSDILSNNSKYSDVELESTEGGRGTNCERCDGDEEVTCDYCDGDGTSECSRCDGDGRIECGECDGDGQVDCDECDGKGTLDDGSECPDCSGKGKIECDGCNGNGDNECYECDGDGETECGECDGRGRIPCPSCQ